MLFWALTWLVMATAFTCAWAFIVKGCEAMDEKNPPKTQLEDQSH